MIPAPSNPLPRILRRLINQPGHAIPHLTLRNLTHSINPRRNNRFRPKTRVLSRVILFRPLLHHDILQSLRCNDLGHSLRPVDGAEEGFARLTQSVQAADFEGGVGFLEADVDVRAPVDFVPLEIAVGFYEVLLVRVRSVKN
jgi:hypothetical protein